MGTKNQPGAYDCYSKAEPDEPMFVLLGRDPVAHILVEDWAALRERLGKTEAEVLAEARECAVAMFAFAERRGKGEQQEAAEDLRRQVIRDFRRQGAERARLEIEHLRALCRKAAEALEWCSGSSDFALDGQAREGWDKIVVPLLEKLRSA